MHAVIHDFSLFLNSAKKKHDRRSIKSPTSQDLFKHVEIHFWIFYFYFLVCAHAWQLNVCLGRGVRCQYVSKCVSVKVGWCLFLCLNTKTEKWSDRSNGWVNKLPVCQSERVPARARPLFAPLASHANLPVNLYARKLHCLQLLFICLFLVLQSPPL